MLPQRCTWLYVMNNVLMSVSGNSSLCAQRTVKHVVPALRKSVSCREVLPAVLPQPAGPVRAERNSAEEDQQPVPEHQPLHREDQLQVYQQEDMDQAGLGGLL